MIPSEFYFGSLVCTFLGLEIGLFLKTAHTSYDTLREFADKSVVTVGRLVEVAALYGNAVLGTLKLCLKFLKVLIGLEFGILLADGNQTAKCTSNLILCLLELL